MKRFVKYYRPHRLIFTLDMSASLTMSLLAIVYPMITRRMLNDFIPNGNTRMVVFGALMLLGVYMIRALLRYFIQYQGHMMGVAIQANMRTELFHHYECLPYSFFDNNDTGRLMSRVTSDLQDVSELAHHGPENIIISSITILASFIYLSTINFPLALIIFVCVPSLTVLVISMRRQQHLAFAKSRVANAEINAAIQSSISGIRVTKAFTNEDEEEKKFEKGNKLYREARRLAYLAMARFHATST
ncbi:MAG: ABC transporter ATP-binding protein, partial [Firmicutes bacterium]|nr:ABC transporter ATP-binding protein [Bacillota bacterium]